MSWIKISFLNVKPDTARWQRAAGEDGHLCTGSIFPTLLLDWSSLQPLMHIIDWYTYIGLCAMSLSCSDHLYHTVPLSWCLRWQSQVSGKAWTVYICPLGEKREWCWWMSGWRDERQMVFAFWRSRSGVLVSLNRHRGSMTCSDYQNGSLPVHTETTTEEHAALNWAID